MTRQGLDAVKERIAKAQEQLAAQLASLQSSDDWRRTLERMAILGPTSINRYSFRNILLLMAQCPEARNVATFNAWKELGRTVKRGAKSLTVLRPRIVRVKDIDAENPSEPQTLLAGFSYLNVFDVEQTEGAPIPEPLRPRPIETPEGFGWTIEALRALVMTLPGVAGITLRNRRPGDHPTAGGWFDLNTHQIVVISSEVPAAQQIKTLLHEVAHAILHDDGEHHATSTAEVEAESTAFVVSHALGLDTAAYSLPYVATWALEGQTKEPTRAVAAVGERVRKAAVVMLSALNLTTIGELDSTAPVTAESQ